jgi:carbonic anhydrase
VIAALLEFAADHPEREVVIYGHADTAGAGAHNDTLSEQRARNVQLYLADEREAWAAHCQEHFQIADRSRRRRKKKKKKAVRKSAAKKATASRTTTSKKNPLTAISARSSR